MPARGTVAHDAVDNRRADISLQQLVRRSVFCPTQLLHCAGGQSNAIGE